MLPAAWLAGAAGVAGLSGPAVTMVPTALPLGLVVAAAADVVPGTAAGMGWLAGKAVTMVPLHLMAADLPQGHLSHVVSVHSRPNRANHTYIYYPTQTAERLSVKRTADRLSHQWPDCRAPRHSMPHDASLHLAVIAAYV